jgi:hypothetical protein
MVMGVNL